MSRRGINHLGITLGTLAESEAHLPLMQHAPWGLGPRAGHPRSAPGYFAPDFEDGDGLNIEAVHMPSLPT